MKIYVLDSGLLNRSGHHDYFARGLKRIAAAKDWQLEILANKKIQADLAEELSAKKIFTNSTYDLLFNDEFDGKIRDHEEKTKQYVIDLKQSGIDFQDDDVFFLPTATPSQISGVGIFAKIISKSFKFHAIFHWGDAFHFQPGSVSGALLRQAARTLVLSHPAAINYSATHTELQSDLEKPLGRPVHLFPSLTFFEKDIIPKGDPITTIRIGVLGSFREQKGTGLIVSVAQSLIAYANIEFIVQANQTPESIKKNLGSLSNVHIIENWINDDEFVNLVNSLDCVLMPYDTFSYSKMISGIFTVCAGYGVPAIVPSNTWMSDRICDGEAAGIVYNTNSLDCIKSAILSFYDNAETLKISARYLCKDWRNKFSASEYLIKNFQVKI